MPVPHASFIIQLYNTRRIKKNIKYDAVAGNRSVMLFGVQDFINMCRCVMVMNYRR